VVVIVYGCGFLFHVGLPPNAGHGHLIHEVYRSHTHDKEHLVGFLWANVQLVAET
jgi:hypothetical protein